MQVCHLTPTGISPESSLSPSRSCRSSGHGCLIFVCAGFRAVSSSNYLRDQLFTRDISCTVEIPLSDSDVHPQVVSRLSTGALK